MHLNTFVLVSLCSVLLSVQTAQQVFAEGMTSASPCGENQCEYQRSPLLWFESDPKAQAVWAPFGIREPGAKSFEDWVKKAKDGTKLPEFRNTLSLNCWEYVLYVSLKLGAMSVVDVKSLYTYRAQGRKIADHLGLVVGTARYVVRDGKVRLIWPREIQANDVVFMDDTSHVVQLVGQQDANGRQLVISFSPRPIWGDGSREHSLPGAKPEVTTIESLIEEMVELYPDVPSDWDNVELKIVRAHKKEKK